MSLENTSSNEDVSGMTNKEVKEQNYRGLDMDGSVITKRKYTKSKNGPAVEATIQMALTEVRNPFMNRLGEHYHSKFGFKRKEKVRAGFFSLQNGIFLKMFGELPFAPVLQLFFYY